MTHGPPGEPPTRATVLAWLQELLRPDDYEDYGPNGLQVEAGPASSPVRKVATGVTANLRWIEEATSWGADLALVHHGLFWHGAPLPLVGPLGRRVQALMGARLSLVAYHLPLDGHPEVGNAVTLARALGAAETTPAFPYRGQPTGALATFDPPVTPEDLRARLETRVSDRALHFPGGPDRVRTLGIVTGGAPRSVGEAAALGCDAFLTGEATEFSQADARELDLHFFAAGHHRTERFGVQALGARLMAAFPAVEVRYIEVDNPA